MKSFIKAIVRSLSHTQIGKTFFRFLDNVSRLIARVSKFALTDPAGESERVVQLIRAQFPELRVAHGPFKGMRYPDLTVTWGSPFPKLLGSYEAELASVVAGMPEYSAIIDIGSAEGYYAVGLALSKPGAFVVAFDTDPAARAFCQKMAALNDVAHRVTIGSFCDEAALLAIDLGRKALIISDCEGYEKTLFSERVVRHLAQHDVLIEVHDCFDLEISSVLRHRFSESHQLLVIESIDDIKKAHTYRYPELQGCTLAERRALLAERRESIMEWYFFTPRLA